MNESSGGTREQILLAAKAEFLEKGFQHASLRNIVKTAGVTTGAMYGYYDSKEGLFDALVRECYEHVMGEFRGALMAFAELSIEQQPENMGAVSRRCMREMLLYMHERGNVIGYVKDLKVENGEEVPQEEQVSVADALDVMAKWFCLLFGNQFTPDDVLDYYPVDRMMHDIALALMAVQTQTTEILDEFPTKAAKTEEAEPLQS